MYGDWFLNVASFEKLGLHPFSLWVDHIVFEWFLLVKYITWLNEVNPINFISFFKQQSIFKQLFLLKHVEQFLKFDQCQVSKENKALQEVALALHRSLLSF